MVKCQILYLRLILPFYFLARLTFSSWLQKYPKWWDTKWKFYAITLKIQKIITKSSQNHHKKILITCSKTGDSIHIPSKLINSYFVLDPKEGCGPQIKQDSSLWLFVSNCKACKGSDVQWAKIEFNQKLTR